MYTFKPQALFTKGIAYAEFFDVNNNNLLGYSPYVTDFGLNGSMNDGDVEGGIGNQLIISLPDTSRLEVTATTADSALNNMALTIGAQLGGNGVIETMTAVTTAGLLNVLELSNAAAPYGAESPICYILTSTGSDKAEVEANSGKAYSVDTESGEILGFTAVSGATYCVKYFVRNSSADELTIPALFQPAVVRAHFAVNVYSQKGGDAMTGSLVKIRHYYFPRYQFNQPLQVTESQTTPGTTNLSGRCLTYQQAIEAGVCASENSAAYGFIVDEPVGSGDSSTFNVQGIYFVGLGSQLRVRPSETVTLPVKYAINGVLTDISDMEQVTFSCTPPGLGSFEDEHSNVFTVEGSGNGTITVTVTNSSTGVTYSDTIPVTISNV
ncbi:MAG: hypothetical protein IKF99_20295 [Oscillospiraceae bacterium]|nr:hypothetical protein [Oscillospiraceae bacterium]